MVQVNMNCLFLLLMCYTVAVCVGEYSVSILTDPSQGPFRIGQRVQFSCLVEPTPPGSVTYQWRALHDPGVPSAYALQSFNTTYSRRDYHYCYYFCEASVNGTLLGSASSVVEVQGSLYTEESVVRSFTRGGSLVFNVNSDRRRYDNINYLTWYHNGTEIVSGIKYSMSNNGTMLRIVNMVESDAGTYEVKIGSFLNDSAYCDSLLLPLLESSADLAPVTFTVQEGRVPTYDPSSIISTQYVTDSMDGSVRRLELRARLPVQFNSSIMIRTTTTFYSSWYRNGTKLPSYYGSTVYNSTLSLQEGFSLQILYSKIADVTGDYMGAMSVSLSISYFLESLCMEYSYYLAYVHAIHYYYDIPLAVSFWSIKPPGPPSSVLLHFEEPILTVLETTTVECTAVGGGPVETFNLTLWRNEELVASVNGRHLSHMTTPSQYGTYMYRCSVDSLHSTALLTEKAPFHCPGPNDVTRNDCLQQFTSTLLTSTSSNPDPDTSSLTTPYVVGFFAGVAAGILITVMVIAVIICVQKARSLTAPAFTSKPPGSEDMPTATNKAFKSVDPCYENVGAEEEQEGGDGTVPMIS